MDAVKLVALFMLTLAVCRAAEWRTTPTNIQYEVGSEVILSCELDNLNIALPPSWTLLTEGAATATTITDGTNIATEFNDLVELVGDQNNGEWNLKIKSISFDQQGEYSCTSLLSDPQKQSATIGVWAPVKSVMLTGGEDSTTVKVPKPDETFTYTRTCKVDNVKPVPTITWTYSTTSDNNLNVAGELPEDFEMGPLPDDDLPEGGINSIKVDTTSSENGDSTSNVASVLSVNYTSSSDNDGNADPNLKTVATCKVSQDPYVGNTLTMESSQLTVDVTPHVPTITTSTENPYIDVSTVTTAKEKPSNILFTDIPIVAIATENPCSGFPHQICDCSNTYTLLIVFGSLFAITLALLILTFSLLFINAHGLKVLLKKKSENLAESTYQGLQRDAQLSPYTNLHIENTGIIECSADIELDMASTYASLEEPSNKPDDVRMKTEDVVWDFPRSRIYLKDILWEERFRNIVSGEAWFIGGKDGVSDVIVNVCEGDTRDFKREIEVMASLSKMKGVVGFLGCCFNEDPMYLIPEYAPNGNLHQVLENMKDSSDWKGEGVDLVTFALNVAQGMQSLSEKTIIHREIMTKNIIVDSKWKCKLSGLGSSNAVLTDHRYRQKMKGCLPIRWMAPEVLSGTAYTTGSDVWSFGVLLWEIYSFGCTPYETLQEDDVKGFIQGGKRLDTPKGSTEFPYQIMKSCFEEIPDDRLQVDDLVSSLQQFQAQIGKTYD